MTLRDLRHALEKLEAGGLASPDSPVIIEGHVRGDFEQLDIDEVMTESRCEDDDEPQAVYIRFEDIEDDT